MLSSTAKNLYWMGRYLQRAKATARLIEATQRMALQSRGKEAEGVVAIFGMDDEFRERQSRGGGRREDHSDRSTGIRYRWHQNHGVSRQGHHSFRL